MDNGASTGDQEPNPRYDSGSGSEQRGKQGRGPAQPMGHRTGHLAEPSAPGSAGVTLEADSWRALAAIVVFFAVWATVAPYAGPSLGLVVNTEELTEIVDHLIPGAVATTCALRFLMATGPPLMCALGATLAGFWMSGTHLPLVLQAIRGDVAFASALWHALPCFALFLLVAATAILAGVEQRAATKS